MRICAADGDVCVCVSLQGDTHFGEQFLEQRPHPPIDKFLSEIEKIYPLPLRCLDPVSGARVELAVSAATGTHCHLRRP